MLASLLNFWLQARLFLWVSVRGLGLIWENDI